MEPSVSANESVMGTYKAGVEFVDADGAVQVYANKTDIVPMVQTKASDIKRRSMRDRDALNSLGNIDRNSLVAILIVVELCESVDQKLRDEGPRRMVSGRPGAETQKNLQTWLRYC